MIRVTIADDHQLFAESLAAAIGSLSDFEVVAIVGNGLELVRSMGEVRPDLVLLDLDMPGLSGIQALAKISNPPPALVVTMHTDMSLQSSPSVRGVIPKSTPLADLAIAARAAVESGQFVTSESIDGLRGRFGNAPIDPILEVLTKRERELLGLMADGVTSTTDLADRLFISRKTVKNHLSNVFEKLAVDDRAQAALEAVRLGLSGRQISNRAQDL